MKTQKPFKESLFYKIFLTKILVKWIICFVVGIFFTIVSLSVFSDKLSSILFIMALISWIYPALITISGFFYGIYKAITE